MSHAANVNVICRFRPMNELEKTSGNEQVCVFTSPTSLQFNSTREKNRYRFNFDRIFPPSSTQQDIYSFGVKGIIDSVLDGYNGTVLAYDIGFTDISQMNDENAIKVIGHYVYIKVYHAKG